MRKRASCDACHLRKTKCDLEQQQAQAQAGCTFCRSLRIPCRISPPKQRVQAQHKKGRRIRELLADVNADERADAVNHQQQQPQQHASPTTHHVVRPTASTTVPDSAAMSVASSSRPGLLGIPGLSAAVLRQCVEAFLNTLAIWITMTEEREEFIARFELFLRHAQGLFDPENDNNDVQPASELFVIAVAARGALHTPTHGHLAELLKARFTTLIQQPDYLYLQHLDGIEAVTLINESGVRPLHPIAAGGQHPDCMTFDPFGKGFVAELCLFAKLNEETVAAANATSKEDYLRRCRLFWTVYCHDALRSASAMRMYRLHDEDIGWPIEMDARIYPTLYLASLARTLCRVMLSARARLHGIDADEAGKLMRDLASWSTDTGIGMQQLQALSTSAADHHVRVKQAVFVALAMRLSLSVWTAIQTSENGDTVTMTKLKAQAETEADHAVGVMVQLADILIQYDLMRYGPTALVGTCAGWVLYLINTMPNQTTMMQAAERVHMAERLLTAIRSVTVHAEQAIGLADVLQGMLYGGDGARTVRATDIAKMAESAHTRLPTSLSDNQASTAAATASPAMSISAAQSQHRNSDATPPINLGDSWPDMAVVATSAAPTEATANTIDFATFIESFDIDMSMFIN